MVLRPEQLTQLAQTAEQNFQNRLAEHLGRSFPEQLGALGQDGARQLAQQAIEKARAYGLKTEQDIAKYADVMSAFGRDFDRNAATAWASSILNDPALADPGAKVNRLAQEALNQARALEARAQPLQAQGQQALEAAGNALNASAQQLEKALRQAAEEFPQNVAGSIVQGCQLPAPPEDLCMGKGFADPQLIENYVKDFKSQVLEKWGDLKPDQRFEAVKKLQEEQFRKLGIPIPDISRSVDEAAGWLNPSKLKAGQPLRLGMADAQSWGMTLNGHLFEKSALSDSEQRWLAETLLHESRHIEQYFKAAQQRAAEGLAQATQKAQALSSEAAGEISEAVRGVSTEAQALRSQLGGAARDAAGSVESEAEALRNKVQDQIAEALRTVETETHTAMDMPKAVLEEAVRNPLPQVSSETGAPCENFSQAKKWFDAKWGKGELSQYKLPYRDRPLEKDAFALHEILDRKW